MTQSEELSTEWKNDGNVKKQPELSLRKLHPLSILKHFTDTKGHLRLGTCKTSCRIIDCPPRSS